MGVTNASTNNGAPGYGPLATIAGDDTFDRCILEFDLEATSSQFKFEYIFASEEYPEFVTGNYNDAFAFFVSGPGIVGNQNIGLVPGTNDPVTIKTINDVFPANVQFYIENNMPVTDFIYDGYTTVLQRMYS